MKKMYSKKNFLFIFILFIISALFVLIMSYSTSPLYPYYFGGDSAQFQTIGKGWSKGMIPYKDMFDHKGPIIFFIDMLGFLLTGTSLGIMLLQIIFMFFTLFSLFLLSKLFFKNYIGGGIVYIFLALIILTLYYNGGNTVEEYCLPFIGISLFFQLKFFYSSKYDTHFPLYAGFYGITFAVCLFTRITNGVAVFCGIFVITIMLLINKSWKSLLQNILYFVAGALVIILPFCIYFSFHGVLKDLFFASITYNLEYQSYMESWILSPTGEEFKLWVIQYFSSYSIFITAYLSYRRNKKVFSAFCIIAGLSELYLFLSGAVYAQYAIITLPQIILLLNEIGFINGTKPEKLIIKIIGFSFITTFCFYALISILPQPADMHNNYQTPQEIGYESLLDMIPEEDHDSFIAYGPNIFKELYLLHNLMPCYKYFVIQEWHASFSQTVKNDIKKTFLEGNAKWILTEGDTPTIQGILDNRYFLVAQKDTYKLYSMIA